MQFVYAYFINVVIYSIYGCVMIYFYKSENI